MHRLRHFAQVALTTALLVAAGAHSYAEDATSLAAAPTDRVIAIDIVLVPDETMVRKAVAANAMLREDYPKGYTLGKDQAPHITLVQRYVREKDLEPMHEAVAKVCRKARPLQWRLRAFEIGNGVWSGLAITYINVERTPELYQFQQEIVDAVRPYAVAGRGGTSAFSTSKELPEVENDIVKYVETFVPKASGANYSPHVTFGVGNINYVSAMKSKPFEPFEFQCVAVADYQLGNYGTAQKKLWEWTGDKQSSDTDQTDRQ